MRSGFVIIVGLLMLGAGEEPEPTPLTLEQLNIGLPQVVEIAPAERKKICATYEGEYIAYYGAVYYIQECKSIPLTEEQVSKITRKKVQVKPVDGKTISAFLPATTGITSTVNRSCKELEGRYITFSQAEVFYIEGCEKRQFPDWETYLQHRSDKGKERMPIISISWQEFSRIKAGKEFSSLMDKENFAEVNLKQMDVIPIDEACKGVEGRYVAFYSKTYLIQECKKREVDPEWLFSSASQGEMNIKELTGEQYISLPDGKPFGGVSADKAPDPKDGGPIPELP